MSVSCRLEAAMSLDTDSSPAYKHKRSKVNHGRNETHEESQSRSQNPFQENLSHPFQGSMEQRVLRIPQSSWDSAYEIAFYEQMEHPLWFIFTSSELLHNTVPVKTTLLITTPPF